MYPRTALIVNWSPVVTPLCPLAHSQANGSADDGVHNLQGCLACELDGIIQDMYTPGSSSGPVMPHRFIYALWLQSKNLAGYQQHDAHEFFICCVDELSKACEAYSKSSSLQIGPLFSGSCLSSVALNFQTIDQGMQYNLGKFADNGCCGYVLKPQYMIADVAPEPGFTILVKVWPPPPYPPSPPPPTSLTYFFWGGAAGAQRPMPA
jgi:hypothetical protein